MTPKTVFHPSSAGCAKATWEEQSSVPAGERPPDERTFNTLEGLATPAHCDAKRVGEATRGSQNQSSLAEISKRRLSKNLQIAVPTRFFPTGSAQERPKDPQHPPKSFPNPIKIDPESIPRPFWSPSCTHAGKKIDWERPKSGQEAPKSAQKATQTVPNPS